MTRSPRTAAEESRFAAFNEIQEQCFAALAAGKMQTTMTLDTLAWIDIIQEIKGRNPRNFSQLLRDDQVERLEAAIERLHDEALFMATARPGKVADNLAHERPAPPPRSNISSALRDNLKGPKP